ncbi:MAG: beta-glucosidase [Candidatus Saccharibacteria bacterium]|nr:beta-glucosidase [Candidatus Saccharibacteria bacterium]
MIKRTDFPDDFLWGASTASHQVEGGTVNQWSVWELAHAADRAQTAKQRLDWMPSWPDIRHEAEDPANYVSGKAVDHYNRFEEDFDIVKVMGLNAFRFGIEWSRLQPTEGAWDVAAVQHYHDYIAALRKRGIEPILNLWHWTQPTWFTDKGGFTKRANLVHWNAFVKRVAEEYASDLRIVLTLNETNVYSTFSYLGDEWPPGHKNVREYLSVNLNLITAHKQAYRAFKAVNPDVQIGMAQNMSMDLPLTDSVLDKLTAKVAGYAWNYTVVDRVKHYCDFIGFNYYFANYWHDFKRHNPKEPLNDMGWYMEPSRVYDLIMQVHKRYGKPIYITENGVADAKDEHRQWWLEQTIEAMAKARADGADLRGYMHWSLLDNFEWAEGWWPKFGLIKVDRKNGFKRTARASAKWWAKWLRADT